MMNQHLKISSDMLIDAVRYSSRGIIYY